MRICRAAGTPTDTEPRDSVRFPVKGGRYRPVNFSGSMMLRGGVKTSISFAG